MGNLERNLCIFTNKPIKFNETYSDRFEYFIEIEGKPKLIKLPIEAASWDNDNTFFIENKLIFNQLLLNNNWPKKSKTLTIEDLKSILKEFDYPRTPKQKLETLFLYITKELKYDGFWVEINQDLIDKLILKTYLKSEREYTFYLNTLINKELIDFNIDTNKFTLTYEGLEYKIKLEEEGDKSNKCFIAMAFRDETENIRNAIKNALDHTGFEPILIDEKIIESHKTINDEIIANLKRCKFCIADFTYHSKGVYFESGFAVGQGKKVIYTCERKEFEQAHFDLRPLQHIIYDNVEQLENDLINKIEAWIK